MGKRLHACQVTPLSTEYSTARIWLIVSFCRPLELRLGSVPTLSAVEIVNAVVDVVLA
jgi:hypothetical protein